MYSMIQKRKSFTKYFVKNKNSISTASYKSMYNVSIVNLPRPRNETSFFIHFIFKILQRLQSN